MKFESAINICQSNCGILHLSPLHLCKDMHSFDAATMPGCNFSILMGILCDYPQNRSSKIVVPCNAVPCLTVSYRTVSWPMFFRALPCRTMLCRVLPCLALPYTALLCHVMPCHALLCSAVSCRSMSFRTMPCPMSVMPGTC